MNIRPERINVTKYCLFIPGYEEVAAKRTTATVTFQVLYAYFCGVEHSLF